MRVGRRKPTLSRPQREDLAQRIHQARTAQGLTREQLATRAGISRQTVHNIEAARGCPLRAVLRALGDALGLKFLPPADDDTPPREDLGPAPWEDPAKRSAAGVAVHNLVLL